MNKIIEIDTVKDGFYIVEDDDGYPFITVFKRDHDDYWVHKGTQVGNSPTKVLAGLIINETSGWTR